MLPADRRNRIAICDAPLVEGAVMAANEAATGGTLAQVRAVAEALSLR
jgi:dihydroxyacetone kinase DhaKLM complex PTS-EIIA-like component DhaM